jgi:DNA replication initiation complex subunit (GINS family)
MYDRLYAVWKQETENREFVALYPDFYRDLAGYLKALKEESRMVEKKAPKASLMRKETQNVKSMIASLLDIRGEKLVQCISDGKEIPAETLAQEEHRILSSLFSVKQAYTDLAAEILKGSIGSVSSKGEHEKEVLRFLKDVPVIIGSDLKPYGPFGTEEVGSLPQNNAKALADQGIAKKIEET